MKFKLYTPLYISAYNGCLLPESPTSDSNVLIACDDEIVAIELYNFILNNYNLNKEFKSEDFNEALEHALNTPEHKVKQCNLAIAVFNHGGCFVAQMGKSRVILIRPTEQEIEYDSRSQVLDIYSSKAKVEIIKDIKEGDYLVLSNIENVDDKTIKKVLYNSISSDDIKEEGVKKAIENSKSADGRNVAAIVAKIGEVSGSPLSLSFLNKIKPKHIGYAFSAIAVLALASWLIIENPFSGFGSSTEETINPDSLVSTQSSNRADTTFIKQAPDTTNVSSQLDSLENLRLKQDSIKDAKKKAELAKQKAEAEAKAAAEKAAYEDIKIVESNPNQSTEPTGEPNTQPN